ncbi:site-2 protease family protein [Paenibacillus sambharensis]|uniref:Site-2 protease family protein n=1 Tax=Paenibacillus sambharensis TaxID=1803190 RepID=A0A2W1LG18_9BACL|nr:site-2 protease family protein [Paenibacillus sambharensis]PZD93955.1 site-2 protease family protein [Paenibacillus sambharensis]
MDFLQKLLWYPIEDFPFIMITLVVAFTLHEFAHAYSAYKFGDHTAYNAGRVTLNPAMHLDVLGTILIMIAGFGWARPVPVNRGRFKSPRLMGIIVSAVGPLSNLLIAAVSILAVYVLNETGLLHAVSYGVQSAVIHLLNYMILINVLLFIFNLIPLPPLDGYRIIEDLAPQRVRIKMDQNAHWGMFIFLLIVFIPSLREVTLDPLFGLSRPIIYWFQDLYELVFSPVDWFGFQRIVDR